jgi:DNA invertase Pin-like site-specific DNA recombinase
MPSANRLTVGIMAMVAEEEARMISQRTKAALAAAKARGIRLGTPNLTHDASRQGALTSGRIRAARARQRAHDLRSLLSQLQKQGVARPTEIAAALNEQRIPASRGGVWSIVQVQRLLRTIAELPAA